MRIRFATLIDTKQGIETLRQSITELCLADHHNKEYEITSWLANKTIEAWTLWLTNVAYSLYVADEDGTVIGVGLMGEKGEVLLNYVKPNARYRRVSKALLAHMEAKAVTQGYTSCSLESTKTAYQFYLKHGYKPLVGNNDNEGLMTKKLTGIQTKANAKNQGNSVFRV